MTSRRQLMIATAAVALPLPFVAGCGTPLPLGAAAPAAQDRTALEWLRRSAERHGLAAFRNVSDLSVAYDGEWEPLIDRIQPDVVDKGYRQRSEERLLPRQGLIAQAHQGPEGRKQVWRQAAAPGAPGTDQGQVQVWRGLSADRSATTLEAAAMVADSYATFLLGPLWLASRLDRQPTPLAMGTRTRVEGRDCQWIEAWLQPGLGLSGGDRLSLAIDVDDHSTRCVRITLEGASGTRGAVAEVRWLDLRERHGVWWPVRFFEQVVHPLQLPAHAWQLVGLDINRGLTPADLQGPVFLGRAGTPARRL